MVAHDDAVSKRHRKPSVKLTDIDGGAMVAKSLFKNCSSKNRHFTNLSSNQTLTLVETNPNNDNINSRKNNFSNVDDVDDINNNNNNNNNNANLDNVVIGSWKSKSKKSPITKRVRSNWASFKSKPNDMHTTYVEDSDNNEHSGDSPVNDNVRRGTRASEEGPVSDGEARDWNLCSERNGVKAWLDELGLGRYAPVFEIHEVDDEVLPMLTLEDLKDMGISAVGSRRKMYCSIQKLNKGFS